MRACVRTSRPSIGARECFLRNAFRSVCRIYYAARVRRLVSISPWLLLSRFYGRSRAHTYTLGRARSSARARARTYTRTGEHVHGNNTTWRHDSDAGVLPHTVGQTLYVVSLFFAIVIATITTTTTTTTTTTNTNTLRNDNDEDEDNRELGGD